MESEAVQEEEQVAEDCPVMKREEMNRPRPPMTFDREAFGGAWKLTQRRGWRCPRRGAVPGPKSPRRACTVSSLPTISQKGRAWRYRLRGGSRWPATDKLQLFLGSGQTVALVFIFKRLAEERRAGA